MAATKYMSLDNFKAAKKMLEHKIKNDISNEIENALEIPSEAIEEIGQEINDLVLDNEKEVQWLETLSEEHEEFETNLIELDSDVNNMRLFTFFSFLLNVIFFIVILMGGIF